MAAGGGTNHRRGLYDAILIKENHAALAGGVGAAVARARATAQRRRCPLEVECRDLDEVDAGARGGGPPDPARQLPLERSAARPWRTSAGRAELEASGGVTLERVREIAGTGVDFVSVGALTHSAPALDLSLILEPRLMNLPLITDAPAPPPGRTR